MLCEKCIPKELKAMRALESLTPNGSEFVNDPERCVAFVRDRLSFTVALAKQRNELRTALLSLVAFAEDIEAYWPKTEADTYLAEKLGGLFATLPIAKKALEKEF